MAELSDLYKEVIFDHSKHPRNHRAIEGARHMAAGHNPLCGDKVTIFADVKDGVIADLSFQGKGCAISTASASMLTQILKGKTEAEADELFRKFVAMLTDEEAGEDLEEEVGKLQVFSGVKAFPMRVKCATLAWHTLHNALAGTKTQATTE